MQGRVHSSRRHLIRVNQCNVREIFLTPKRGFEGAEFVKIHKRNAVNDECRFDSCGRRGRIRVPMKPGQYFYIVALEKYLAISFVLIPLAGGTKGGMQCRQHGNIDISCPPYSERLQRAAPHDDVLAVGQTQLLDS